MNVLTRFAAPLVLAVAAPGVLAIPASATVPFGATATAVEGQLLAPDLDPAPQYFQFESVSNEYFTFQPGLRSEVRPEPWQVRSTVTGLAATDVPPPDPERGVHELAGRSTVRRTPVADGIRVDYSGIGGAPTPGSVTVPAAEQILAIHEKGVLVVHSEGADKDLRVRRSDGSAQPVTGLPSSLFSPDLLDQDGDTFLVKDSEKLYTVDIATAAATLVTSAPLPLDWAAITPGRIIWESNSPGGTHELTWKHRNGSPGGTVSVPFSEDLTTIGDDVAVLAVPTGGTDLRREIARVALADGEITRNLIGDVAAARALADGRLLLARTDAVITLADDLTQRKLADIPPAVLGVGKLAISGGRVLNSLENGAVRETTVAGSQWFLSSIKPSQDTANELQIGGGTVYSPGEMVVRWPGGQRSLDKFGVGDLGRGGKLMSYMSFNDQSTYSIQNPRTGAVLATRPTTRLLAMDGLWVWQGPDPVTHAISGTDVSTGQIRTVPTSVPCPPGSFAVAGRWALVNCDVHQQYAVDLLGVMPVYRLPDNAAAGELLPAVGDGFVARFRFTTNADGVNVPELLVTDLNSATHPERVVGPLRGRVWPPGGTFALDDEAARIVYADPESRARVVNVNWLAAPPSGQADSTAPSLTSSTTGPRVAPTRTLGYSYAFTDAGSGVASYDVRFQQRARGATQYGGWQQPAGWQKITGTKVTMTASPGVDTCFQVRARDKAGNTSNWSASACSTVDYTVPRMTSASTGARVALSTPVRFGFGFTDDQTVASYDVAYRSAAAGKALGAWVYPAGWQAIRSTSVTMTPAIGADTCFQVRARDAAGNVSGWSTACAALPQDDRAFTAKGTVARTTYAGAYRTTLSRLQGTNASLGKSGEAGNRIAVTVLAGPNQGAVDVAFAGRRIGRVSLAATTWSRKVFYLPMMPWATGTVTVTSVSALPSSVDGIALLRY